jgi:hypothetical protein
MDCRNLAHTFHIPVMGIGFSIDTPLAVAPLGISSVISLVDDGLMEKMREMYCRKLNFPFESISPRSDDSRARRITAYLNLMNQIVSEKVEKLKLSIANKGVEFERYIEMLPEISCLKKKYQEYLASHGAADIIKWFQHHLIAGSIDVNIMTKLDVESYRDNEKLPVEYNDAHAALRGFAQSDLESAVVLSAGLNPRLYSYFENFGDFFPDASGYLRKKIILKTSDYRSALIQGKFLAKKGLWVSEFRVESGLNCGGHAFASDGYLMGPILEEFRENRELLMETLHGIWTKALTSKNIPVPDRVPGLLITAQGGVGTSEEHEFLLNYYQLDSVGWGTPFLLVPEVCNVDEDTLQMLEKSGEDDLYLSTISPLGVPFNSRRGNRQDEQKMEKFHLGKPGSNCPKQYARLNHEFPGKPLCTASRLYQSRKIKELDGKDLSAAQKAKELDRITEKACLCIGLGVSALKVHHEKSGQVPGVSICPGPNLAYFSKRSSLQEMVDHIYGRGNLITVSNRPNLFIKELGLYLAYFRNKVEEAGRESTKSVEKDLLHFKKNLEDGISYYRALFQKLSRYFSDSRENNLKALQEMELELESIRFGQGL